MSDDDNEPAWGDNLPGSSPSGSAPRPMPNQRSMPVVRGFGAPPRPRTPAPGPKAFPTVPPTPTPPPVSPPAVPPVTYPMVPTPRVPGVPPATGYPPPAPRESFVHQLMQRGVRGELLRQPWFHDMRQRNPEPFVYVTYAVGVVVGLVLLVIPSSFVVTVLSTSLWVGIGYLYFALGTKFAHQFLLFGVCLVGGLVMAARALSAMVGLSVSSGRYYGFRYESVVELMFVLLINLAGVAAFAYIGVQVFRGIQRMSQP